MGIAIAGVGQCQNGSPHSLRLYLAGKADNGFFNAISLENTSSSCDGIAHLIGFTSACTQ